MKHIFYAFAIPALMWELVMIFNSTKYESWKNACKITEREHVDAILVGVVNILLIGYFTWTTIGLFTAQWPIFLGLILLSVLGAAFKLTSTAYSIVDAIISALLITFAIINQYHLNWFFYEP